jgi:tetratricopeptide (TPR) repeat protein
MYIDGQKQSNGSDGQGLFFYTLAKSTMLVEAKKKGFLSATKTIFLAPERANSEITLELEPISATLKLSANIESARVTVDNSKPPRPVNERIILSPGRHTLTIEALGYTTMTFDLIVKPDELVTKEVKLERLPLDSLQSGATSLFSNRAYDDVLKLCRMIQQVDSHNALAHRLIGQVYLERGEFANARAELQQALANGERVMLLIRRHAGEKVDVRGVHSLCNAELILTKTEVEFRSAHNAPDNFKVPYDQLDVVGIQLKNSVAPYLATKVTTAGRKRDFNFYSYDKELSQEAKRYLEMIQSLLLPH